MSHDDTKPRLVEFPPDLTEAMQSVLSRARLCVPQNDTDYSKSINAAALAAQEAINLTCAAAPTNDEAHDMHEQIVAHLLLDRLVIHYCCDQHMVAMVGRIVNSALARVHETRAAIADPIGDCKGSA